MKTWCKHIREIEPGVYALKRPKTLLTNYVPKQWKFCPFCGCERPTRENVKAAALRFAIDND